MSEKLVPQATKTAAKRGFIRTAAESLSTAILTTRVVVGLTSDWRLAAGLGAGSTLDTAGMA